MKFVLWLIALATVAIFTSGCAPTYYLQEGEQILNSYKFNGNKLMSEDDLSPFVQQKPSGGLLQYKYHLYFRGKKIFKKNYIEDSLRLIEVNKELKYKQAILDSVYKNATTHKDTVHYLIKREKLDNKLGKTSRKLTQRLTEGNALMRIGTPPIIYDSISTEYSSRQLEIFLHQEGFFHASTSYKVKIKNKYAYVTYNINEKTPYRYKKITIEGADGDLLNHTNEFIEKSNHLKDGKIFSQKGLEKVRSDLTSHLKDEGYFDFTQNYIFINADTTIGNNQVKIKLKIETNKDSLARKKYILDEVVFHTDQKATLGKVKTDSLTYDSLLFLNLTSYYNPKILRNFIRLKPGQHYSITNTVKTQNSLARLDVFKFINVNYERVGDLKLKANIFTNHYEKNQLTAETGFNFSQTLPDPFVNFSWKRRNIFKSFEILELKLLYSVEAQGTNNVLENNTLSSQQYGANLGISFPQILFPFSQKQKEKLYKYAPISKISSGYMMVNRPEYTRSTFNSSLAYNWTTNHTNNFDLELINLSLINTRDISGAYLQQLIDLALKGNSLINSFDNSLVNYSRLSFSKSTFKDRETSKSYLTRAEIGGWGMDVLSRSFGYSENSFAGLRYYKYLKLSGDVRRSIGITKEDKIVMRLAGGAAHTYLSNDNSLPYEKYFFSGGANSNRAWPARRVGPGSFTPTVYYDESCQCSVFDYTFEQPGNINIEYNIEYRRPLFSYFHLGVFLDATNVWTFENDQSRPGSQFTEQFWREFAIGGGLGLRLDLTFFVIRLDLASKIYDPARPVGYRYVAPLLLKYWGGEPGQTILNFGVGYPF